MMRKIVFVLCCLVGNAAYAANDLDSLQLLGSGEFKLLSEDLGAALSYKALAPAESQGLLGFDVGVEVTATKFFNGSVMDLAMGGSAPSYLPILKVHAHKGLPLGFDVGAMISKVPGSNIKLLGAELRYALTEGGTVTPAVGIRATMSTLSGVDQLDLETQGLELTVSKGFTLLTPYVGVGKVRVKTEAKGNAATAIALLLDPTSESIDLNKVFAGVNINMTALNILVAADKTGDATTYGLKFGWRF